MKPYFTIFTPTYNRAYMLKNLYQTLCEQTYKNFEWLIIDDGSTDDTQDIVKTFIDEQVIDIRYIYQDNQGKHVAINRAAELALGKWFFIVDSDDRLIKESLRISKIYCDQIFDDSNFAGVVGLRADMSGKIWDTFSNKSINNKNREVSKIKNEIIDATCVQYRYKLKMKGDRAEIVKTEVLKKYKFPKIENENFMSESWLWYSLSRDGYLFRWFHEVIYITEYLEDGLTQNSKNIMIRCCKSKSYLENFTVSIPEIPIIEKIKAQTNYYRFGVLSGDSYIKLLHYAESKILSIIAIPLAVVKRI